MDQWTANQIQISLNNIDNQLKGQPSVSPSSSGPILTQEQSNTLKIGTIILVVVLAPFALLSIVGTAILIGLSETIGEDTVMVLLFLGGGFLVFLLAIVLLVVLIVRKRKRKKKIAKQNQYINNNQNFNPTSGSPQAFGNVPKNASKVIVQQRNTQGEQNNGFSEAENRGVNTNLAQNVNSEGEANQTPILSEDQIENLKKLKDLLDAKILTEEEFNIKKKEILGL